MKFLTKILFACVMIAGLSVVGLAQKDDQKRPKPPPPVVKPGDKKAPKNEDKPKRTTIEIAVSKDSAGVLEV